MRNIIQKIKDLFNPVELNFVEYLCHKRYLDQDYHVKIRQVVRCIHKKGSMSMQDYRQFIEMGISFGEGTRDKVFESPYPYKKVIARLIELTDNKYTKEDIEKSCGVGLEGKDLEKFNFLCYSRKNN